MSAAHVWSVWKNQSISAAGTDWFRNSDQVHNILLGILNYTLNSYITERHDLLLPTSNYHMPVLIHILRHLETVFIDTHVHGHSPNVEPAVL